MVGPIVDDAQHWGNVAGEVLDRLLHKTKPCRFFDKGCCEFGSSCRFAHGGAEARPVPDLRRTRMCRFMEFASGCWNDKCTFAHSLSELRRDPDSVAPCLSTPSTTSESPEDQSPRKIPPSMPAGHWSIMRKEDSHRSISSPPSTSEACSEGTMLVEACSITPPPGLEEEIFPSLPLLSWPASSCYKAKNGKLLQADFLLQSQQHAYFEPRSPFPRQQLSDEMSLQLQQQQKQQQQESQEPRQHPRSQSAKNNNPNLKQLHAQQGAFEGGPGHHFERQGQQGGVESNESDDHFEQWRQYHVKNELRRVAAILDSHLAKAEITWISSA